MKHKRCIFFLCMMIISLSVLAGCRGGNMQEIPIDVTPTVKNPEKDQKEYQTKERTEDQTIDQENDPVKVTPSIEILDDKAGEMVYKVQVTDDEGKNVEGARVQFCTEDFCMTGKTGPGGVAEFNAVPGKYEVHFLKVPEGYIKDDTVYITEENSDTLKLVLTRGSGEDGAN